MEFKLADIGEGMQEAEILRWFVKEGDAVREDQPLLEIQTDKVTVELPSPWRGIVRRIALQEGSLVTVGSTLVEIEVAGAGADAPAPATPAANGPSTPAAMAASTAADLGASPTTRRVLAAPATRRRARELGVNLALVPGSGPGGRVEANDLDAYAIGPRVAAAPTAARAQAAPVRATAISPGEDGERIPLRGLRRVIARNMTISHQEIPQASHLDDCDVTELAALRARWNRIVARDGGERLSYLPFIVRAAAVALRRHPWLNAQFDAAAGEVVVHSHIHIGIATDTDDGLIVTVVRDADRLPLRTLQQEIGRLTQAAREHHLVQQDTEGGTFTITNHGSIGGLYGAPIIRHPEVAILGVGRIRPEAVVRDAAIVARDILHFGVTFDHRVLDGGEVTRFANEFSALLEDPDLLFMEIA